MSTGLIVIIAVVVIALIVLAVLIPRMRARAELKRREKDLEYRRDQVASAHRESAAESEQRAEAASQRARIAEQEARREQAEAELAKERAALHERGLADDELIDPSERADFEGTSAVAQSDSEDGVEDEVPAEEASTQRRSQA